MGRGAGLPPLTHGRGDDGIRTRNILLGRQTLDHLSFIPTRKATPPHRMVSPFSLPAEDSNLDCRYQKPESCRWTNGDWWLRPGSNRRPHRYERRALPTTPLSQKFGASGGTRTPDPSVKSRLFYQLNYRRLVARPGLEPGTRAYEARVITTFTTAHRPPCGGVAGRRVTHPTRVASDQLAAAYLQSPVFLLGDFHSRCPHSRPKGVAAPIRGRVAVLPGSHGPPRNASLWHLPDSNRSSLCGACAPATPRGVRVIRASSSPYVGGLHWQAMGFTPVHHLPPTPISPERPGSVSVTQWTCGDLNPEPPVCHTGALPVAPQALHVAPRRGFEPRYPDPKTGVLPLDERGSTHQSGWCGRKDSNLQPPDS